MNDYADYTKPVSNDKLAELAELAETQAQRELAVNQAEEALKKAKEELRLVSEIAVPELMDEIGLENFTTRSGLKVSVKETIRANIPKDHAGEALHWLRENGHGGVIKRTVKLEFGKGKDEQADELVTHLRTQGYDVGDEQGVHFMTLSALARELLHSGQDMPAEVFGIHRQSVSKIG